MPHRIRLALALAAATAAAALSASSAFALSATVEAGGAVSATGIVTFEGSGISTSCPMTLRLSLLRGPITLAAGNQIGEVTEVSINRARCSGGSIASVLSLPWRIVINEPLPSPIEPENARGLLVNFVRWSFTLEIFGGFINCLYSGNAGALIPLTRVGAALYTFRMFRMLETIELPLISGSGCPARVHISGTFTLSATQTMSIR
jgi:hypothetical protein